jgi:fused signal recognition particle receptor
MLGNSNSISFFQKFFEKTNDVIITDDLISSIENTLLDIDILSDTATKILKPIIKRIGQNILPNDIISIISTEMIKMLKPYSKPLEIDESCKPQVVLVCGINGVGKTSAIGKMTYGLTKYNWKVVVAACDTFRAAATEQLSDTLTKNINDNIILVRATKVGEDPGSIAYKAYDIAKNTDSDLLIIDTAGRLYNHANLMEELSGISRTLSKKNIAAPHNMVLVIDGNTGKNAIKQVEEFSKIGKISGIIVTKLDGQARCGIILSIVDKFGIKIHGMSTGENMDDLHDFIPENFVKMLLKVRN